MAFKLTKAASKSRDEIVERLEAAREALTEALSTANDVTEDALGKANQAVDDYNEALSDAREFRDDVAGTARDAYENKSERWQESGNGRSAIEWIDSWKGLDLDALDHFDFEELEDPNASHADELAGLSEDAADR